MLVGTRQRLSHMGTLRTIYTKSFKNRIHAGVCRNSPGVRSWHGIHARAFLYMCDPWQASLGQPSVGPLRKRPEIGWLQPHVPEHMSNHEPPCSIARIPTGMAHFSTVLNSSWHLVTFQPPAALGVAWVYHPLLSCINAVSSADQLSNDLMYQLLLSKQGRLCISSPPPQR